MIRVDHLAVLARKKPGDRDVELVEADVEVPWVTTSRFEPQPSSTQDSGGDDRQEPEADQRWPLGELVHGDASRSEDRDAVGPVDLVIPEGVGAQYVSVEVASAHDDSIVVERVSEADRTLLHSHQPGTVLVHDEAPTIDGANCGCPALEPFS